MGNPFLKASAAVAVTAALTFASASHPVRATESTAELVAAVARAQANVDELTLGLGDLQESVNRALVDLRDAQARAEQARRGAENADERLKASEEAVAKAREELSNITRSQYRGAGQSSVLNSLSSGSGQREVLERSQFLKQRSKEKQDALEAVERARAEAANEASVAREAAQLAETAADDAANAETNARQLLEDNAQALNERNAALAEAQAALDAAEGELGEVRPGVEKQEAPTYEAPEVDQEIVDEVTERVAEIAPEAPSPEPEVIAQAVAAAQIASPDNAVEEASNIAASAALVGSTQTPHATFADPYASGTAMSSSSDLLDIVSAFAGGLQTGLGVSDTAGQSVSDSLSELLPAVETAESITEEIQQAVAPANSGSVETAIARAMSVVGTPYVWGGGDANGPTTGVNGGSVKGFDCSGLVLYAFAGAGVSLPHYTGYQYQRGTQIDPSQAQRGDLLFWGPGGSQHVAIYLGDGTMIEAPQAGQNVSVVPVRWANMSPKAVRLL
ncbi:NlpC/P60 family protein [Corynebacterium riegelii]|uniref:NlpC/P60 family protein n=1 Tax=Corynebacterium riegelii TaxID=156976 RepID=UPI0023F2B89F|nr:NlpC/P60 family protein [Corynebacterium riegelii]